MSPALSVAPGLPPLRMPSNSFRKVDKMRPCRPLLVAPSSASAALLHKHAEDPLQSPYNPTVKILKLPLVRERVEVIKE
jgi:hypothetical protein